MDDFKNKYEIYRNIRKRVWNEATYAKNSKQHDENKSCLKNRVSKLCEESYLSKFRGNSDDTKDRVWHHLWTKIRYAGIKADIASKEIADISSIFDLTKGFLNKHGTYK